jgi:hypothetical protein
MANAVNADGSVVVGVDTRPGDIDDEAFRWSQSTGSIGLGFLPGDNFSQANAVNADGSVVVGLSGKNSVYDAFIWTPSAGMLSIQDALAADGVDLSGWRDLIATGVSADGHVIVGNGVDPTGHNEAWIAHLPPNGTTDGPSAKVIQTDSSTSLTEVGDHYLLYDSNGAGPSLKQGGMDVVAGEFASWTPIGAVQTASGYDVAWKNGSADQYTVWNTDSSGNFLSYNGVMSGNDYALESLEPTFGQDLNGDGLIGPSTIGASDTVEVVSAYSGQVSLSASTGSLEILNSSSFTGTVAGMTGQDTIDFADIDPTKVHQPIYSGNASGGTLTVTDGSNSAKIALLGDYMASTFVTSSDGHGGTNVVDPPVVAQTDQQPNALVNPHHA